MNRKKSYSLWFYAARVLPVFALTLTLVFYFLEAQTLLECVLVVALCLFLFIAIYWWWWIMLTSKDLFDLIGETNKKFIEVLKEVKDIKKEVTDANNRERRK
jgi:hypothetical protein